MKKALSAVLAVTFLSTSAFAGDQSVQGAPPAQDQAAQDKVARDKASIEEQRHQQFLDEVHNRPAKKQAQGVQGGTGQGSKEEMSPGQGGAGQGSEQQSGTGTTSK